LVEAGGMLRLPPKQGLNSDWDDMLEKVRDFFKKVKIKEDPTTHIITIEDGRTIDEINTFLKDKEDK